MTAMRPQPNVQEPSSDLELQCLVSGTPYYHSPGSLKPQGPPLSGMEGKSSIDLRGPTDASCIRSSPDVELGHVPSRTETYGSRARFPRIE